MMEDTIGEIAIKLLEDKFKSKQIYGEGLLCIGPKGAGKTTLLNTFLEKDETNTKETLSLEYTFGRKSIIGQYGDKNICHIWELGGSILPTQQLLNVPIKCGGVTFGLVVIDLAQGPTFWNCLKDCLTKLTDFAPLPIYIVGGKYDLYKKLDLKQRTQINKMLRAAALLMGSGVFMFSKKEPNLIRRTKEILNQLAFGQKGTENTAAAIKTNLNDMERPLQIAYGKKDDSWDALGYRGSPGWIELGEWLCGDAINREDDVSNRIMLPDPSLESSFREPLIDALRVRKDHQLQLLVTSQGQSYF